MKDSPQNTSGPVQFLRNLGLFDATTIVIGSLIGSGIFLAPSIMAGYVETPGILILLWFFCGIITLFGALSNAELSAAMPKAGGQYVFLREAYSPLMGFLYGWTTFLVIQTGFIAAVAVAFAKYLGVFFPGISENVFLFQIPLNLAGYSLTLSLNAAQIVGILSIVILTGINIIGVKTGAIIQNIFTVLKVGAILVLLYFTFTCKAGSAENFFPFLTPANLGPAAIAAGIGLPVALAVALSKAFFAYDAWYNVTYASEEIKEPHKNIPMALLMGTAIVTVVYTGLTLSYLYLVPIEKMASIPDNRIAAETASIIFGTIGVKLIALAILISTFGCNNGLILSGPRVFYAMAKDGLKEELSRKSYRKFFITLSLLFCFIAYLAEETVLYIFSSLSILIILCVIFENLRKIDFERTPLYKKLGLRGEPWEVIKYIAGEVNNSKIIRISSLVITPNWLFRHKSLTGLSQENLAHIITPRWVLNNYLSNIYHVSDIMWVYNRQVTSRLNFALIPLKSSNNFEICINLRDGKCITISVNKLNLLFENTNQAKEEEKKAEIILREIYLKAPWIKAGYTSHLNKRWFRRRNEFISSVDQNRLKYLSGTK